MNENFEEVKQYNNSHIFSEIFMIIGAISQLKEDHKKLLSVKGSARVKS